ncbi:MAG: 5'-deoxynucleotidase [Clostridia bacterium]|nr:5'-deoxynucleotidase [Clostridia bacterium]
MAYSFFALASRMKYINRWGLMRNLRSENLTEHSAECAMLSHALALIGNRYFGKNYDENKIAVYALYHDMSEIFTGDLPTPVKYFNDSIRDSYKSLERNALDNALSKLPEELRGDYTDVLLFEELDEEAKTIVKAADKLCAYLKCVEEYRNGNNEFKKALESSEKIVTELGEKVPEVKWFMDNIAESYEKSIDEL